MTKPLKKTKNFSIIAVFMMLTIVIGCFTTACTSPKLQETDAVVQPIEEDSDVETSADKTLPEETPDISDEQQEISEEVLQALQKYAINNEQTFEYLESEDFFGDKILFFFGDDITLYRLFESDLSLKALGTKTYNVNLPIEISEEEAKNIIIDFAKKYWPVMEPEITKLNYEEEAGYFKFLSVEGVLKNTADQSKQPFHGTVNGKGELISIGRTPNIDIEQCIPDGTAMTLEQAKEYAYKYVEDELGSINIEKLKTVTEKLDNVIYTQPVYIFEFEYRTDHPTTSDFSYDAYVAIKPSTGEFTGLSVNPILDNIDVIPIEEAEQIAKEYAASHYGVEIEKLTTSFRHTDTYSGKLFYSFGFDYGPNEGYSITMCAVTGQIDGVAHSTND